MKIKTVGKKIGVFPDENGVAREYAKLYVLCEPPENVKDGSKYEGLIPDTYSISRELLDDVPLDCYVTLTCNSKGKVMSVELVD